MLDPPTYSYKYQGGSLAAEDPTYVWRSADDQLFRHLLTGDFCYVFNARQMGKSSLRVRTMTRLQTAGIACAAIDLAGIGRHTTPEQWYKGILFRLFRSLPSGNTHDWRTWWDEHSFLPVVQRWRELIATILLNATTQPIVIFIDEIDSVLNLDFPTDDFFACLRTGYDQRATHPDYQRLTFCLLGVTTPSSLIQAKGLNPFNIGQAIALQGFTLENAKPSLIPGLAPQVNHPESVLAEILAWTGGQPFLTQKLCQLVIEQTDDRTPNIQAIVRQSILKDWETQDQPEHLRTIRDRLLRDKVQAVPMLERYLHILQQGSAPTQDTIADTELQLTGLLRQQHQQLSITNYIYARIFNEDWTTAQLQSLWFLNQDWHQRDANHATPLSQPYLWRVFAYHMALISICTISLWLAYDVFHSRAWAYAYGPHAGLIEFLRSVMLSGFNAYLVFILWRSRAIAFLTGNTPKAKRFRRVALTIFSLILAISLYHNLYNGPQALLTAHQQDTSAALMQLGLPASDPFREYFLPSFFYTPYSLALHLFIAVPFSLISIFAATEDYAASLDNTIDLVRRIDAIKQNSHIISRQITQISDIICQTFDRYAISFISLITPYTAIFLVIEIIRNFETRVGLATLTEPGQGFIVITYSYSVMAALIILWMFTHYQRALSTTYKALTQLGYDHSQFLAANSIFQLCRKLVSLNGNLILLILIISFNLIDTLIKLRT